MIVAIAKRIRMDPHELRDALWLAALLLSITSSYTLVKVARDVQFLSVLPASTLPIVYLIVGVISLLLSWVFGRVTRRWSPFRTLMGGSAIAAVVLAAFAFGFEWNQTAVPIAFYTWVNVYGLLLTSQFWIFTNSVSDPRKARNIFGIVGGGGILGGLIGGVAATVLAQRLPPSWLALIGAMVLAVMVGIAIVVRRGRKVRAEEPAHGDAAVAEAEEVAAPLTRSSYVRWLAIVALCSVVATGLLDYQLKTVVQRLYPSVPGLTSFFGRYFIVMNVAALALQLLGTRWFLARLGAPWTAGLLPVGLAIGAGVTLAAPSFVSVLVTRLWDQIARFSIHRTTTEVFYFPLHADVRRRAKAFIEAGIERFGDALAGVLILLLGMTLGIGPHRLAGIILGVVVIWIFAWWRLRRGYVRQLARHLRQVGLERQVERFALGERSAIAEMVRALESPYERVVLQALDMLEETAPSLIQRRLQKLLAHRSAPVRARAVVLAAANPSEATKGWLEPLLRDPDPMVRIQALKARGVFGEDGAIDQLERFLDEEDPGLRGTALSGIVEHASEAELPRVRELIESRLAGDYPSDRVIAAEAIGARPAPFDLHALLPSLFEDEDVAVRRAALRSAGRAHVREYVTAVLGALADREVELAARDALVAYGDRAVGTLGDWLADPDVPIAIRRLIPRVLQELPMAESISALLRPRDHADVILDYRILKAMNHLRVANRSLVFPVARVEDDLVRDVGELLKAEFHADSHRAASDAAERFLLLVLQERRQQALDRVFRRLALIHPPQSMFAAYQGLRSRIARVRGNAVEYVENVLSMELRALIMPLMPDATEEERHKLAQVRYGLEPMDARTSLTLLLESGDAWLRTCALYVVGKRRERALAASVESSLAVADARVRETAGWARGMLVAGAA